MNRERCLRWELRSRGSKTRGWEGDGKGRRCFCKVFIIEGEICLGRGNSCIMALENRRASPPWQYTR